MKPLLYTLLCLIAFEFVGAAYLQWRDRGGYETPKMVAQRFWENVLP